MHFSAKSPTVAFFLLLLVTACGGGDVSSRRITSDQTPSPAPAESASPSPTPPSRSRGTVQASPTPVQAPPGDLARAQVGLTRLATFDRPLAMALRSGDENVYIAQKGGRIRAFRNDQVGATVLDISAQVSHGGEQGLLGLAFSPDGSSLYVNFTNTVGDTIVREYAFTNGSANVGSARDVLVVDQPYGNHNGGNLVFGPDDYLYVGLGDGGSGGDPQNRAQNLNNILGKMLRIDPRPGVGGACGDLVEGDYRVPPDNPFVGKDGCDAIWAFGYRNPWRYTFDRLTGDMLVGDVGQGSWEEIDHQAASSVGGENYGWRNMEGAHPFGGNSPPPNDVLPIYEYENGGENRAVTGGYVYRGSRIPLLRGAYVFADYAAGRLRAFELREGAANDHRFLGPQASQIASFGEDASGELYVLSLDGGLFRIDPA